MALKDDLGTPGRKGPGAYCTMGILLQQLDADDRAALENALADTGHWSGVMIAEVLRDNGHDMYYWTVNRHRSKMCRCP